MSVVTLFFCKYLVTYVSRRKSFKLKTLPVFVPTLFCKDSLTKLFSVGLKIVKNEDFTRGFCKTIFVNIKL